MLPRSLCDCLAQTLNCHDLSDSQSLCLFLCLKWWIKTFYLKFENGRCIFSCPGQLNRWHCQSVSQWVTSVFSVFRAIQRCGGHIGPFWQDQKDEEAWKDQQEDKDVHTHKQKIETNTLKITDKNIARIANDCKSLLLNVKIQVSQFVTNSQLCH